MFTKKINNENLNIEQLKNQERLTKLKLNKNNIIVLILGLYIFLSMLIIAIIQAVQIDVGGALNNLVQVENGESVLNNASARFLVFGAFEPFIYFTVISNLFVGIMVILIALFTSKKLQRIFFTSVIYITITFLVFWVLISYTLDFNEPFSAFSLINDHLINPILVYLAFYIIRKRIVSITNRTIYYSSIGMIAYFFFSLVLYFSSTSLIRIATDNKFPNSGVIIYSFLDFNKPFFISAGSNIGLVVFLDIIAFLLAFWLTTGLAFLLKLIYKVKIDSYTIMSSFIKEKHLKEKDFIKNW